MNKEKILIKSPFFREEIERSGGSCVSMYKRYSRFFLMFGNFTRKFDLLYWFNLNPQLRSIDKDTIIVFDGGARRNLLKWISRFYVQKRLIFYYWNPVSLSFNPRDIPKEFEKWSYSPNDCEKFDLKYNSTFFFPEYAALVKNPPIERDVFFIGINKNRLEKVKQYESQFAKLGLSTEFRIVENKKNRLTYAEVLEKDARSRCIFDYYTNPQAGLSLRAMEALFLEKKLITNNESILDYDFFNSDNIFVLGQRKISELNDFVRSPYSNISEEIKQRYSFDSWLDNFQ